MFLPEDKVDKKFINSVENRLQKSSFGNIVDKYYGKFKNGKFFVLITDKISRKYIKKQQIEVHQIHLIYENDKKEELSPITLITEGFYTAEKLNRRKDQLEERIKNGIENESELIPLTDLLPLNKRWFIIGLRRSFSEKLNFVGKTMQNMSAKVRSSSQPPSSQDHPTNIRRISRPYNFCHVISYKNDNFITHSKSYPHLPSADIDNISEPVHTTDDESIKFSFTDEDNIYGIEISKKPPNDEQTSKVDDTINERTDVNSVQSQSINININDNEKVETNKEDIKKSPPTKPPRREIPPIIERPDNPVNFEVDQPPKYSYQTLHL